MEELLDILKAVQWVEHREGVAILERKDGLELCVLQTYKGWRKEMMVFVLLGLKLLGDERSTYLNREAGKRHV